MLYVLPKISPSEPLFLSLNVLNAYQINIFQSVEIMHKIRNKNVPHMFLKLFTVPCHAYPTNFSLINFSLPRTFLKTTRFAISAIGSFLWNNFLSKNKKNLITFYCSNKRLKKNIGTKNSC